MVLLKHYIHFIHESLYVSTLSPKSEAFALGDAPHVGIWIGGEEHGHTVFEVAQEAGGEIGDGETRVEEYKTNVAAADEVVIFGLR